MSNHYFFFRTSLGLNTLKIRIFDEIFSSFTYTYMIFFTNKIFFSLLYIICFCQNNLIVWKIRNSWFWFRKTMLWAAHKSWKKSREIIDVNSNASSKRILPHFPNFFVMQYFKESQSIINLTSTNWRLR